MTPATAQRYRDSSAAADGGSPLTISGSGAGNQPPAPSPADIAKGPTPGLALVAPVTPHQVQPPKSGLKRPDLR
eukprot:scaffold25072_cov50-Phaeocystis_antarctica.AAC.2